MTEAPLAPIPTVSHVGGDGTLAELLYDARAKRTSLAVRKYDGTTTVVSELQAADGHMRVPYRASNNLLATGCVLLPSAIGVVKPKAALLDDIRAYLRRYVDISPFFEELAAHYVLLTWVYDRFGELGYLRFRGDFGTGKTRALLALGSICYKPFFASGASTVSPIFHILDAFGGTLVLDEADFRFSDATADLTKILNNGNVRGMPVLRSMANRHRELSPTAFRVFGPKLIAMREAFDDEALESRFLTEEMGSRSLRADVPLELPEALGEEALTLRNDLLAWRFAMHHQVAPASARAVPGVEPRFMQATLALMSLIDSDAFRQEIVSALVQRSALVVQERAASPEGTLLRSLIEAFVAAPVSSVTVADVTRRFNEGMGHRQYQGASNRRVGWLLRNRLRLQTMKSNGVYVVPQGERVRIETLAARHGIQTSPSPILS